MPPQAVGSKPMIAVVIDDLGLDRRRSARVIELAGPLTLAFLPYAQELPAQTAFGHAKGHELLVHVPMEPVGASYDPGPDSNLMKVGLSADEIRNRLERDLAQFAGYVGINNHMGSKFTSDKAGMRVVLKELQDRGLLFLDSRTSAQSVGAEVARDLGLPFAERNVFLDNVPSLIEVSSQLEKLESYARQYGHAIAIGHPHDGTIEALTAWLPTLEAKGLTLVPVSAIVKRQASLAAKKQQQ
ncbi:MAG: divergent polysaccharide deacetylase family protein [Rhodospirillales bacterium]|nr:divergent polysaccharide deacetylase family protein [Rhodospirillales bacterium]